MMTNTAIRGGENSEAALDFFWKIFDLYFEISNFLLDFLTTISTNLYIPKVRNVPKKIWMSPCNMRRARDRRARVN
jgi:hypothetical protein